MGLKERPKRRVGGLQPSTPNPWGPSGARLQPCIIVPSTGRRNGNHPRPDSLGDGGARRDGWTLVGRGRERLTYTRGARRDVVEDAMVALRTALVVTYTAVLGSLGIVLCLLVPGGAALMPLARLWSRLVLRTYRVRYRASFPPAFDSSAPACTWPIMRASSTSRPWSWRCPRISGWSPSGSCS